MVEYDLIWLDMVGYSRLCGISWDMMEYGGIWLEVSGYAGICSDILEYCGKLWDLGFRGSSSHFPVDCSNFITFSCRLQQFTGVFL